MKDFYRRLVCTAGAILLTSLSCALFISAADGTPINRMAVGASSSARPVLTVREGSDLCARSPYLVVNVE